MTPEGKVKVKIREYLKARGDNYSFTPIGSGYGTAGVPDRIVCWRGQFIGIEVKAPGKLKTQTPIQKKAQQEIEKTGGVYLLVDSVETVKEWFEGGVELDTPIG
ncbi:MAG: VRR-NUC domain-containing protein [Acidithiobacillus sp.]|nr:VRR-NUC domain-containing protein [Acidithiobacillus sp.]